MHGFPTGGAWLNKVKVNWFLSVYKICSCHTQVPDFRWPMKVTLFCLDMSGHALFTSTLCVFTEYLHK
jgi:hypothetical protein